LLIRTSKWPEMGPVLSSVQIKLNWTHLLSLL